LKKLAIVAALALSVLAQSAAAAVIHDLPNGVARDMPAANRWSTSPEQFGGDITFTARHPTTGEPGAYYGYTTPFIFNDVVWSGTPAAMVGYQAAIMSFSFDAPVSAFLAELAIGAEGSAFALSAYNAAGKLLETVNIDTWAFSSGFYGFQRATNDISRIDVSGYYFGVRNIETLTETISAVPEPATWAMMIIGFGGVGVLLRRSRREGEAQFA